MQNKSNTYHATHKLKMKKPKANSEAADVTQTPLPWNAEMSKRNRRADQVQTKDVSIFGEIADRIKEQLMGDQA
ncbi:hypothetical protein [Poriferisphaera sp. WC338]|uniref:hypothetical protein n=1 Tax=Poriferisphaera sp. WC338 TaxID=3425129 RepID=UPI003D812747